MRIRLLLLGLIAAFGFNDLNHIAAAEKLPKVELRPVFPELKLDIGHDHFWQRGYGVRAVTPGELKTVRAYVRAHQAGDGAAQLTARGCTPHRRGPPP